MSFYTLELFAHILGVLGLFIGIGLQWISVLRFRRAQFVAQVREWTSLTSVLEVLMPTASLLILVAGSYMTVTTWGWRTPWIDVSLAALILVLAPLGAMNTHRLKAIQTAAEASAPTGTIPAELQRQITHPILWTMVQTSGMTLVGVVFLMTIKPDLMGSLITMAVALGLGIVIYFISRTAIQQVNDLKGEVTHLLKPNAGGPATPLEVTLQSLGIDQAQIQEARQIVVSHLGNLANDVVPILRSIFSFVLDFIVVAMLSIYFLIDGARAMRWLRGNLPFQQRTIFMLDTLEYVVGGYIRGSSHFPF